MAKVSSIPNGTLARRWSNSGEGVSRWVHPILFWPLDPIILVEGKGDRELFEEAFQFFKPRRRIHVVDLPALGSSSDGGVHPIHQYIKANANAIRSRRTDAAVIVVLDWDAAGKLEQFKKLVKEPSPYKVLVWPEGSANPRAGKCFRGVERFLSDRVLDCAMTQGAPIGRKKNGEYVVAAPEYDSVKKKLAEIVRDGLERADFVYAEEFVRQVLKEAEAA